MERRSTSTGTVNHEQAAQITADCTDRPAKRARQQVSTVREEEAEQGRASTGEVRPGLHAGIWVLQGVRVVSSRRLYQVEYFKLGLGWRQYMGVCASSLDWCKGFVAAMDSIYPCDPLRIVETSDGRRNVVYETNGRGSVHLS